MEKNKTFKKYLNYYQIISILLVPIFYVLDVSFSNTNAKHLIRIALSVNIIGDYFFLQTWHKEGITWFRKDSKFTKRLTRKPADVCLFITAIKTLVLCLLMILVDYDKLIQNEVALIIMFTTAIISMILFHLITKRTYKQVMEIVSKKK